MSSLTSLLRLASFLLLMAALSPAHAAARGLKDYQHTVWSEQHGAPADITALAQTADGWLWIGSSDGLFRFDGVHFEAHAPAGHPALAHMRVVEMHAADNGDLYVSYFPRDVAVLRRDGSAELLPAPKAFRRTPPLSMVVDRDGSLWTIGHGIRRYADGQWTTVEDGPAWIRDDFYSMLLDQDDRLWAAAPDGVWLLDRKRGRFDKVSDARGGLALAPGGDVWLIGPGGGPAVRLAGSVAAKARPVRAGAVMSRLAGQFASDGTLWTLGCPQMACLVHDAAGKDMDLRPSEAADERIASSDGNEGREELGILEDREGNIWIHAKNGLNQFRPKRFVVPQPRLDLTDYYYSAAADGAGRVCGWRSTAASWRCSTAARSRATMPARSAS